MKVLIVCSGNAPKEEQFDLKIHQAFIYEQVQALTHFSIEFEYFFIRGKGLIGYFKHIPILRNELKKHYELIHAHNGLCGLIANLQKKIPVITTYHGSDINIRLLRWISYAAILLSFQNIFVTESQYRKSIIKRKSNIVACGVDITEFQPFNKQKAIQVIALNGTKKYILFSSSFSNKIKNQSLAKTALKLLNIANVELLELKGKTRKEVSLLLNSCELLILTSFSEGSPQIIKEAMACNCPIVSTDVGDVREVIGNTEGCYITSFDPADVAEKIKLALEFSGSKGRTNGRQRIFELGLDAESIAKRIIEVYDKVLNS
jgi:teichuronic acid biosynthesis glycosyltransferase TuaC